MDVYDPTSYITSSRNILAIHDPSQNIRFFSLGRHAFKSALQSLEIGPSDTVLVPSFLCKEMLAPIHESGATPIFYDIDFSLNANLLPKDSSIKAVLAVNYFGFPQELSNFKLYCSNNNIALIEDNAHGFLSADLNGEALGTRGDYGIFSYRKTLPIRSGASLLLNSQKHILKHNQIPYTSNGTSVSQKIRVALDWLEKKFKIQLIPFSKTLIRSLRKILLGYKIKPASDVLEYSTPLPENPPTSLVYSIRSLNIAAEINRRRLLYEHFHERLFKIGIKPVFGSLTKGVCPYGYPFFANDALALKVVKIAKDSGFDCYKWPELPSSIRISAKPHYHQLWVINFLC